MKKDKSKPNLNKNSLIKKSILISEMKKHGINRVNPESIKQLDLHFKSNFKQIAKMLKEEMQINARKTLLKKDVLNVLNKLEKEEEGWEV